MISLTAYKIFIWGIFTLGWIGVSIIAVAAVIELYKLFSSSGNKAADNTDIT